MLGKIGARFKSYSRDHSWQSALSVVEVGATGGTETVDAVVIRGLLRLLQAIELVAGEIRFPKVENIFVLVLVVGAQHLAHGDRVLVEIAAASEVAGLVGVTRLLQAGLAAGVPAPSSENASTRDQVPACVGHNGRRHNNPVFESGDG
jgi:hypothetical protein